MRIASVVLATFAAAAAVPVSAQSTTLADWVGAVEERIDRSLNDPRHFIAVAEPHNVVVRFTRGSDGRAVGAAVKESSGSAQLDQRALDIVNTLGELPALPAGYPSDMAIAMRILFESSAPDHALAENGARDATLRESRRETNRLLAARYERR